MSNGSTTPPYQNVRVTSNPNGSVTVKPLTNPPSGATSNATPGVTPGAPSNAPSATSGLTTPVVTRVPQASPDTELDPLAKESIKDWTPEKKIKLLTDIPALNWPESERASYRPALTDSKIKNKDGNPIKDPTEILKHKIRENFAKMIKVGPEQLADIPVKLAGERDSEKLPNLHHELLENTPIYPFINTSNSTKRYEALKSIYNALGMPSELINEFPYTTQGGSRRTRMRSQRKRSTKRYIYHKKRSSSRRNMKRRTKCHKQSRHKQSRRKQSRRKQSRRQ
jgi:hypothetical protein